MNYIYNDEDNAPMNDEFFRVTGYHSQAELEYHESGQAERDRREEYWNEQIDKERKEVEGLSDMLGLTGECRKCRAFTELAEGFFSYNGLVSTEQVDFLKMQCSICGGKGTGKPKDEQHEKWREGYWKDIEEWVKQMDLKFRGRFCPNVYRIYGQYKDPDDEWKAIEEACCNCKYFGED